MFKIKILIGIYFFMTLAFCKVHAFNKYQNDAVDGQFYKEAGQQYINEEVNILNIWQEAILFWQSDATRKKRWINRAKSYYSEAKWQEFHNKVDQSKYNKIVFNHDALVRQAEIVSGKIVDELTIEVYILGFFWLLMGLGVILTDGQLWVLDLLLTILICFWFGVKTYYVKKETKSFIQESTVEYRLTSFSSLISAKYSNE